MCNITHFDKRTELDTHRRTDTHTREQPLYCLYYTHTHTELLWSSLATPAIGLEGDCRQTHWSKVQNPHTILISTHTPSVRMPNDTPSIFKILLHSPTVKLPRTHNVLLHLIVVQWPELLQGVRCYYTRSGGRSSADVYFQSNSEPSLHCGACNMITSSTQLFLHTVRSITSG